MLYFNVLATLAFSLKKGFLLFLNLALSISVIKTLDFILNFSHMDIFSFNSKNPYKSTLFRGKHSQIKLGENVSDYRNLPSEYLQYLVLFPLKNYPLRCLSLGQMGPSGRGGGVNFVKPLYNGLSQNLSLSANLIFRVTTEFRLACLCQTKVESVKI